MTCRRTYQRGVTLVELIIAIVVISVALSGVTLVVNFTVSHSVDPLVDRQALGIAESYLEEILLKSFADPGGGAESGRADYDDVDDYHGLSDAGARDQNGVAIPGLADYSVSVTVAGQALGSIPASNAKRIEVVVSHPGGVNLSLVGFRVDPT